MNVTTAEESSSPEHAQDAPSKARVFAPVLDRLQRLSDRIAAFFLSRRFRLVPTVMTFAGVAVLASLGTWQMLRLQEKNALLEQMRADLASPVRDLRQDVPRSAAGWEKLHYHPVKLQGTWIATRSFRLSPRTFEGQAGYHLILPLRLADNQVVLVDRGFVPDGAAIMPPKENDVQVVLGVARVPEAEKPRYAPDNLPARNEWVWLDLKAMGHEVGVGRIAPVVVYEDRVADRDSYPIGGQVPLPMHNRHKQYAVTWYCLALALMGIWMIASTPKPAPEETKNPSDEAMDPVARRGMYPEATD